MGKKKLRHPDKSKGGTHYGRRFSETPRGKRLIEMGKRARQRSAITADFAQLAHALDEQIYLYVTGNWENNGTRPKRLIVSAQEATGIFGMYMHGTLKLALGKYDGEYGKGSRFDDPSVIEAVIDFFEQEKHRPYIEKGPE